MPGIGGLFAAKRKKAAESGGGAPAPSTESQPAAAADQDFAMDDDPFSTFDNRPSTAGSYGFSNCFNDDFGGYGMDNEMDDTTAETTEEETKSNDTNAGSTTGDTAAAPGGLSMFKRSAKPSSTSAPVAAPVSAPPPPPEDQRKDNQPSEHAVLQQSLATGAIDEEASFMPPPPPRPTVTVIKETSQPPESTFEAMTVEEPVTESNKAETMNSNTQPPRISTNDDSFTSKMSTEDLSSPAEHHLPETRDTSPVVTNHVVQQDPTPTFNSHSVDQTPIRTPDAVTTRTFDFAMTTPAPESARPKVTPTHVSPMENTTPVAAPQQNNSLLTTPSALSDIQTFAVTPDSFVGDTHDDFGVSSPEENQQGFDETFSSFLQDLQIVKDKHILSDEQLLEMDVLLDLVIATMNGEILQMQEMEDEIDQINTDHDEIVEMFRSQEA